MVNMFPSGSTFDDCQTLVKEIFSSPLKSQLHLSAINSINWGRILAQIVYYWFTCFQIQHQYPSTTTNDSQNDSVDGMIDVCVPTGNFGNILVMRVTQWSVLE